MERGAQPIDQMVAEIQGWATALGEVEQRLASSFARSEARQRAMTYVHGLLSPTARKNSWQLAESVGHATSYGFQQKMRSAQQQREMAW